MVQPTYEYSGVCYTATSEQTVFALTSTDGNPIGYLSPSHIHVRTSVDSGETWSVLPVNTGWTFADPATSIVLVTPATAGEWIDIQRKTPIDEDWVDFQSGSLLTAGQLNEAETFSLYCDQEIADSVSGLTPSIIGLDTTDDLPEGQINLYYTDARVSAWIAANLSDTDDLKEGVLNLYYTDARVNAWINTNLNSTDQLAEGSNNLYYTDARAEAVVAAWIAANLANTDDLPEGSVNLYFTNARVASWINNNLGSTDQLAEGSTNLYYKDSRVAAWINNNLGSTDQLVEGSTNLYYTDARVESYVDGAGYVKGPLVTKIVAGNNVGISPESGTGIVTINATGGSGEGIPEAPLDGTAYGRQDGHWEPVLMLTGGVVTGDLTANKFIGDGSGLTNLPVESVNTKTGDVVLNASDVGALAAGDNVSELTNDAGYLTSTGAGSTYLPLAGGNLTGNLTLNTDKIVLFADTGAAAFLEVATDGNITAGGVCKAEYLKSVVTGTDSGLYLYKDGGSNANAINISPTTSGGDITTSLGYDGSAEFAGAVGIGTSAAHPLHVSASVNDAVTNIVNTDTTNGYGLSVVAGGSASGRYIARFADAGNNAKAIILSSGTAKFAGDVAIGDSSTTFLDKAAVIAALTPEQRTTFATAITAWNNRPEPYDAEDPTTLPADLPLREAIVRATTAGKINLNADGSITAGGGVTVGGDIKIKASPSNANVFRVTAAGTVLTGTKDSALELTASNANVVINTDGSATFKGNVDAYGHISKGDSSNTFIWTGYYIDGATNPITSTITADGTITANGYSMASLAQL